MPKLPRLRGKELIKTFFATQTAGGTVVPVHSGEIIGPGLLSKILRDTELGVKDIKKK